LRVVPNRQVAVRRAIEFGLRRPDELLTAGNVEVRAAGDSHVAGEGGRRPADVDALAEVGDRREIVADAVSRSVLAVVEHQPLVLAGITRAHHARRVAALEARDECATARLSIRTGQHIGDGRAVRIPQRVGAEDMLAAAIHAREITVVGHFEKVALHDATKRRIVDAPSEFKEWAAQEDRRARHRTEAAGVSRSCKELHRVRSRHRGSEGLSIERCPVAGKAAHTQSNDVAYGPWVGWDRECALRCVRGRRDSRGFGVSARQRNGVVFELDRVGCAVEDRSLANAVEEHIAHFGVVALERARDGVADRASASKHESVIHVDATAESHVMKIERRRGRVDERAGVRAAVLDRDVIDFERAVAPRDDLGNRGVVAQVKAVGRRRNLGAAPVPIIASARRTRDPDRRLTQDRRTIIRQGDLTQAQQIASDNNRAAACCVDLLQQGVERRRFICHAVTRASVGVGQPPFASAPGRCGYCG